jgi:endonuclease YncB( thermonuclease family)
VVLLCAWLAVDRGPALIASHRSAGGAGRICELGRVLDGDSLRLSCDGEAIEVRLHCIDAPERQQRPWGGRARSHLRRIVPPRVEMEPVEIDRFGRTVARVYSTGPERRMLNLEQVRGGYAAVYDRYCDEDRFLRAEREARRKGLGIWSAPGPQQTPWTFRHRK